MTFNDLDWFPWLWIPLSDSRELECSLVILWPWMSLNSDNFILSLSWVFRVRRVRDFYESFWFPKGNWLFSALISLNRLNQMRPEDIFKLQREFIENVATKIVMSWWIEVSCIQIKLWMRTSEFARYSLNWNKCLFLVILSCKQETLHQQPLN